jgi:hypothetical protein
MFKIAPKAIKFPKTPCCNAFFIVDSKDSSEKKIYI